MDLFGEPEQEEAHDAGEEETGADQAYAGPRHPRAMDACLGHEGVEHKLLDMLSAGRIPHGMIFAGPKGIGKATMAYRFSRYLLKHGAHDPAQDSLFGGPPVKPASLHVPADDTVFRRIAAGGHPDMLSIERAFDETKNRYKSSVDVDEVRKVTPFLRMTASGGGWRVVLIDDADTMNRNAQNVILKILEEPPKNTVLILVAHRPGALIPTIRSRAQIMNFKPLAPEIISRLLLPLTSQLSPSDLETLAELAGGSMGRASGMIEENGLETLHRLLTLLEDYPALDGVKLHQTAEELGRNGQENAYKIHTEMMQWVFSSLALAKARGKPAAGKALQRPALQAFLRNSSLEQLSKICESLQSHFEKVETANLDRRQGVLGAFSLLSG